MGRANVMISVARVTKLLRNGNPDKNLSDRAPVFVAGAIEQLVRGLLTNAAASAKSHKAIDHILPEMMTDNKGHEVGQKSRREKQKKNKADKADRAAAKAARGEEGHEELNRNQEGDNEDLTA